MQGTESYRRYKDLAKSALRKFPLCGKCTGNTVLSSIKGSCRNIFTLWEKAENICKEEASLSVYLEWIYDNRYLWEDKLKEAQAELKRLRRISGTKPENGIYAFKMVPRYYAAFSSFIDLCGFDVTEEALDAFISACDRNTESRPDFADFYSFKLLFSSAVLVKLAEVCRIHLHGRIRKGGTFAVPDTGRLITTLKMISDYSFERSFEKCETEEYLRLDPAGFYSIMTPETKSFYRERVTILAAEKKTSEAELVKEILEKARGAKDEKMRHIGAYLYPEKPPLPKKAYFISITVTVCVLTVCLCTKTPLGIFFVFPIWEAVKQITDKLFASFTRPLPLPMLDLEAIPDTDGVLVVITTLLLGSPKDTELFSRLEDMYLSNGMKNIYFAILGDLPDCTELSTDEDAEAIAFARQSIERLNEKYGGSFFLFVRKRRLSGTSGYSAKERKRGAVCELVKYLCGKPSEDFLKDSVLMPSSLCESVRYVLTLDADTNISPDSVRTLAGAMLHPLNKPVIDKKKHIVSSGYGIMQPRISADLESAAKTPFSSVMCGSGGIDIYTFARFDLYQSVFGEANFCGKGIFDKYAFDEVINRECIAFPENTILSHDILEGSRLRTALVTEIEFTDGYPSNVLSYYKRHHRWVRGDVQNLLFCGSTFVNASGERVKNGISALSKVKIADNVRREAVPVISFFGIISASLLEGSAAAFITLASLFFLIYPFISDLSGMISTFSIECAARRFFSKGISAGIWQSLLRSLFEISALPLNAITTLDAFARALYRTFISRKNMLEWITAAQSDSMPSSGLYPYIQKNLLGAAIGTALFVFSPYGIIKLIGFLWFIFPYVAYKTSIPSVKKEPAPSEQSKALIYSYCDDIWKYFSATVSENTGFLPSDNLQLYPKEKLASYTSPTNIGLYLACILCARDFAFIKTEEMCRLLDKTLNTVEGLEKWHGHLYNWYSTENLSVLNPKYISAVDSGNLLACLIAIKEGLEEYKKECEKISGLSDRIENLISDTDLEILYDKRTKLFRQGVTVLNGKAEFSKNYYDMLMSEARTLSYIAIAERRVPVTHWAALSRPLIKHSDRIGVASWSGTAFEYFMPELFLPAPKGSLMYEAMCFAYFRQMHRHGKSPAGEVFGISESGYSVIDGDGNYSYKAFGIPELGVKKGLEKELVISPYSSFLMLCTGKRSVISNLERLKKAGLYGKFGFYEAYDFTEHQNGIPVKSYMSHHMGMSMLACANAFFNGIFVSRFMGNPRMKSIKKILEEKIPVNAAVSPIKKRKGAAENRRRPKL